MTEPCTSHSPIAFNGSRGYAEFEGDLFEGETGKEVHFEDIGLPWIERGEAGEGFVDGQDVSGGVVGSLNHLFDESDLNLSVSALFCAMGPRIIDENMAHHVGGEAKDAGPVLPHGIGFADEPQVGLIDQGCGLEGVIATLEAHLHHCQVMQLLVEAGGEVVVALFGRSVRRPGLVFLTHVFL